MKVVHFRRVFSVLSETFLYEPLALLAQAENHHALTLIRMHRRSRPMPCTSLLRVPERWQEAGGVFAKKHLPSRLSERDRLIWPLIRWRLKRKLKALKPDVVISHFGPDGCLIGPLTTELKIPHICCFYGYDVSRLVHQYPERWRQRYARLFSDAQVVTGISQHIADRLIALGADPAKVQVVHAGSNIDHFSYSDPSMRFDGQTVKLLHVGRLTPKKSPLKLIEAVLQAQTQLPDHRLELTLAGDGELLEACQALIAQRRASNRINVLGAVEHADVPKLMASHHIYTKHCETAPDGDKEGLGVTFIEASACGLPIIATQHNGIPDIVLQGETGVLTPEGDVEAMAAAIADMARTPVRWQQLGRAGRDYVECEFTLEQYAQRLQALAEQAASRGIPTPTGRIKRLRAA